MKTLFHIFCTNCYLSILKIMVSLKIILAMFHHKWYIVVNQMIWLSRNASSKQWIISSIEQCDFILKNITQFYTIMQHYYFLNLGVVLTGCRWKREGDTMSQEMKGCVTFAASLTSVTSSTTFCHVNFSKVKTPVSTSLLL